SCRMGRVINLQCIRAGYARAPLDHPRERHCGRAIDQDQRGCASVYRGLAALAIHIQQLTVLEVYDERPEWSDGQELVAEGIKVNRLPVRGVRRQQHRYSR